MQNTVASQIAREGRVPAGLGRQVGGRGCDRLDTGLLVIGDDRNCIARLLFCGGSLLLDQLDLTIDAQNLRHLLLELRVAALQVIADLVRLYLLLIEDVAQSALSEVGKANVPCGRRSIRARSTRLNSGRSPAKVV
jgi:hypothetical protein